MTTITQTQRPRECCARLNQLIIRIHRSLLQYADLCWPWVDPDESPERELLRQLAGRHRDGVRELVELLDRRGWPVDYGEFPDHFTDLNYVALHHLWPRVIQSEEELLTELRQARQEIRGDMETGQRIDQCIDTQREILKELRNHTL